MQKSIIKHFCTIYIWKVLTKYYSDKVNPTNTLIKEIILELNLFFKAIQAGKKRYQKITALLIFSMIKTQSNIAFEIGIRTCFAKNLSYKYIEVVKTIIYYIKELINFRIIYAEKEKLFIKRYSNSN